MDMREVNLILAPFAFGTAIVFAIYVLSTSYRPVELTNNQTLVIEAAFALILAILFFVLQSKSQKNLNDAVEKIREYSEKSELLQRSQTTAGLLLISGLLQSNRNILREHYEIINSVHVTLEAKLAHLSGTFSLKSNVAKAISENSEKMVIQVTAFEPMIALGVRDRIITYAHRTSELANLQPPDMNFSSQLLQQWIGDCESIFKEIEGFLPELNMNKKPE